MHPRLSFPACACIVVLFSAAAARAAVTVTPDFMVENLVPNTGFNQPTAFAFTRPGPPHRGGRCHATPGRWTDSHGMV